MCFSSCVQIFCDSLRRQAYVASLNLFVRVEVLTESAKTSELKF